MTIDKPKTTPANDQSREEAARNLLESIRGKNSGVQVAEPESFLVAQVGLPMQGDQPPADPVMDAWRNWARGVADHIKADKAADVFTHVQSACKGKTHEERQMVIGLIQNELKGTGFQVRLAPYPATQNRNYGVYISSMKGDVVVPISAAKVQTVVPDAQIPPRTTPQTGAETRPPAGREVPVQPNNPLPGNARNEWWKRTIPPDAQIPPRTTPQTGAETRPPAGREVPVQPNNPLPGNARNEWWKRTILPDAQIQPKATPQTIPERRPQEQNTEVIQGAQAAPVPAEKSLEQLQADYLAGLMNNPATKLDKISDEIKKYFSDKDTPAAMRSLATLMNAQLRQPVSVEVLRVETHRSNHQVKIFGLPGGTKVIDVGPGKKVR